jgi:hypothetical protein
MIGGAKCIKFRALKILHEVYEREREREERERDASKLLE